MPQNQAVAAALSKARKYAAGGTPFGQNVAGRQLMREGFLRSTVPGRTDKLPISVSGGSYVLPADHVAALGQGNSLAGSNIVNKMFKMGPYGAAPTALKGTGMRVPHLRGKFADGGEAEPQPTDIVAAGGEIVIPPHSIMERFGSLDAGHAALDKWVLSTRKQHIKTLRGLKPPRQD